MLVAVHSHFRLEVDTLQRLLIISKIYGNQKCHLKQYPLQLEIYILS